MSLSMLLNQFNPIATLEEEKKTPEGASKHLIWEKLPKQQSLKNGEA